MCFKYDLIHTDKIIIDIMKSKMALKAFIVVGWWKILYYYAIMKP